MSRDNADAVVIGAGHNGLVAAAMLAADGARGWPRVVASTVLFWRSPSDRGNSIFRPASRHKTAQNPRKMGQFRVCSREESYSWKRYPIPASVSRCTGCDGSSSSLRRSCAR